MHFLVDGTHPDWSIFVSTCSKETKDSDPDKAGFATHQERVRKDVECAFGILVQRFHVLQRPFQQWHTEDLHVLLEACVTTHNMTVECRHGPLTEDQETQLVGVAKTFPLFGKSQITAQQAAADGVNLFHAGMAALDASAQSSHEHFPLQEDLVKHIESLHGQRLTGMARDLWGVLNCISSTRSTSRGGSPAGSPTASSSAAVSQDRMFSIPVLHLAASAGLSSLKVLQPMTAILNASALAWFWT